jgi:TRAP-type mannitol/chloroaromatic compound transport system substrate-binding protein
MIVVLFLGLSLTQASAQQPIKWRVQTMWQPQETPHKVFQDFCKRVKILTNGRLEIEVFPGGALVPVFESLDALQAGVIEGSQTGGTYFSGKNPALAPACELSFAWNHPWELDTYMYHRGGLEILRDLYKPFGAYCVGIMMFGVESWPSKKPIAKMADFKGIKIREPQGMEAEWMAKAGASVVILPGGEVYSALDKGVINATNWATVSMNDKNGFHRVAPYFTYPGFHSLAALDFIVRQAEWNKLPEDIKAILTTGCREWCWDTVERVAIEDLNVISKAKSEGKTPIAWSEEEKRKARELAVEIWQNWKKKGPQVQRSIESQEAWLRELGRIK